jgi:hypothetical protein
MRGSCGPGRTERCRARAVANWGRQSLAHSGRGREVANWGRQSLAHSGRGREAHLRTGPLPLAQPAAAATGPIPGRSCSMCVSAW